MTTQRIFPADRGPARRGLLVSIRASPTSPPRRKTPRVRPAGGSAPLALAERKDETVRTIFLSSLLAVLTAWAPVGAADGSPAEAGPSASWLALGETLAPVTETKTKTVRQAESAPEPPCKPPPLPLHSIEGVGGTLTVPTAYVCNPGHAGCKCSLPSASLTYLYAGGGKSLQTFAITQTFLRRIELGYALDRLDLGNFPHAISKATAGAAHIRQDLYMHNFNLRGMLIEENSFSLPWKPARRASGGSSRRPSA